MPRGKVNWSEEDVEAGARVHQDTLDIAHKYSNACGWRIVQGLFGVDAPYQIAQTLDAIFQAKGCSVVLSTTIPMGFFWSVIYRQANSCGGFAKAVIQDPVKDGKGGIRVITNVSVTSLDVLARMFGSPALEPRRWRQSNEEAGWNDGSLPGPLAGGYLHVVASKYLPFLMEYDNATQDLVMRFFIDKTRFYREAPGFPVKEATAAGSHGPFPRPTAAAPLKPVHPPMVPPWADEHLSQWSAFNASIMNGDQEGGIDAAIQFRARDAVLSAVATRLSKHNLAGVYTSVIARLNQVIDELLPGSEHDPMDQ